MTAKHTPGPWETKHRGLELHGPNGMIAAFRFMGGDNTEGVANSSLASASPDMLAALRKVEARLTAAANAFYVSGKRSDLQAVLDGWKADAHEARAVIAKAEGST